MNAFENACPEQAAQLAVTTNILVKVEFTSDTL